jgi:hypothetical protein
MGKTVIAKNSKLGNSGPLLFRKVQLVTNDEQTFGVGGAVADGFLSGYILLANDSGLGAAATSGGGLIVAPVASYGL